MKRFQGYKWSFFFWFCVILTVGLWENVRFEMSLYAVVSAVVAVFCFNSLFRTSEYTCRKGYGLLLYGGLYVVQNVFYYVSNDSTTARMISVLLLCGSCAVYYILKCHKVKYCVAPMIEDGLLSFEDLRYLKLRLDYKRDTLKRVGGVMTPTNVRDIMCELPRNCAIRYVNKDSLSEEYLANLEDSMDDPFVYFVLSDTGSVASNFIGILTNKPYNHFSISFDPALKTLVSYNGGEKLAPPGLNAELLEWFYKKEDASIRVYRLPVTLEQKRGMADKLLQINEEGSAYNLIGATIGRSLQPNIMVCSEFVYGLLKSVGAEYFEKPPLETKPTDMIELDYERKLQYVETLQLSLCCEEMMEKGKPIPMESKVDILGILAEQMEALNQKTV